MYYPGEWRPVSIEGPAYTQLRTDADRAWEDAKAADCDKCYICEAKAECLSIWTLTKKNRRDLGERPGGKRMDDIAYFLCRNCHEAGVVMRSQAGSLRLSRMHSGPNEIDRASNRRPGEGVGVPSPPYAARARGRSGGRPYKMTAAKLRLAMAAMGQRETKVGELCTELGITRQTLYRHVGPNGSLGPDGQKLLGGKPATGKTA